MGINAWSSILKAIRLGGRKLAPLFSPRKCLRAIRNHRPIGIRCYDNGGCGKPGGTVDRYTVVFTGRYRHLTGGEQWYVGMNESPFHPQGFVQHGSSRTEIDLPSYAHLGKKISFDALPADCQKLVMADCMHLSVDLPHE